MSTDSELLTFLFNNEPSFRRARLAALYSDFSSLRTINPDGYQANVEAWRKGFAHAARAGALPTPDLLCISISEDLLRDLETKEWGRPLALGTVVAEAVQKKELLPMKDFLEAKGSIYHKSWAIRPLDILGWGLRQLGLYDSRNTVSPGKLVVLSNLEDAAKEFTTRTREQQSRTERIYSSQSFREQFRDTLGTERALSDADFEVFLRYLQRDKNLLAYDGKTIKLKAPLETSPPIITSEDSTVASLKTLIKDLDLQTKALEKKIDELNQTARQAVEKKNRVSALATLRSKKVAESTLVKRHSTLAQLEEVFSKIEQAADQVELVRVLEASATVLAGLNKEVGGVERVDNVVDQLREQMNHVDDIGNVIAEGGNGELIYQEEIDDELEALELNETRKLAEDERKRVEESESREAAETRRRLDALEVAEKQARMDKEAMEKRKEMDKTVDESAEVLKRMSLDSPDHIPA